MQYVTTKIVIVDYLAHLVVNHHVGELRLVV